LHRRLAPTLAALAWLCSATPGPAGTYVYVHDTGSIAESPRIFGFALARSGELTPLPSSPFPMAGEPGLCGGFCQTLDYSRKRKLLVAGGGSGVSVWEVAEDGVLSLVSGSPFGGVAVYGTALVEVGKRQFVYAAQGGSSQLRGFEVLVGGGLGELGGSPILGFASPVGMRDRRHLLFVSNDGDDTIASFVVAPDGGLTPAPGVPVFVDQSFNVAPDPKGKLLYEPSGGGPEIHGFRVDRGSAALAALPVNPMASGLSGGSSGLAVGRKLVIAVESTGGPPAGLRVLRRARDGTLTPLGAMEVQAGIGARAHGLDAAGRRFVVAGYTGVRVFAVGRDGSLSLLDEELVEIIEPNDVAVVKR
jgi:hypothetical protein